MKIQMIEIISKNEIEFCLIDECREFLIDKIDDSRDFAIFQKFLRIEVELTVVALLLVMNNSLICDQISSQEEV